MTTKTLPLQMVCSGGGVQVVGTSEENKIHTEPEFCNPKVLGERQETVNPKSG